MGMLDFIKDAGEKLLGIGTAKAAPAADATSIVDDANRAAAASIEGYIASMGLSADGLSVTVDGAQGVVTVSGQAADQATREKIILCCGNVQGVEKVQDDMTVSAESAAAQWHTVAKGDTLWAIAQKCYGNGARYPEIFEANRPMLSDPDKIYPGQTLRIPG
ncbi:peptidoglycan-binding protein LysM [Cupriavidus basilensis]|uniref:Peptidoglycan-binding protein LysM n=1 Tax=Cupriavidus basilensis TaxID=68895 RepID=A0ABT6B0H1_9BURK|nr:peptidoglycan-binding protein LysM [Cupriavidus basilensis]MDF3838370.1 peptidoglycan-binding protein LysM [Cupriavidus basilensis]